jgi:hypothetical protein
MNANGEIVSASTQLKYWITQRLLVEFEKYHQKSDPNFKLDFDTIGGCTEELKYFLTKVKGYAPATINKHLKVVRIFIKEAEKRGSGVISVNGKMVDRPVVLRAQRTIDLAIASGILKEEDLL